MNPFLLKILDVVVLVALLQAVMKIVHMLRSRAMRALADRWGFRYIGPTAPKLWNPLHPKLSPPLPPSFFVDFRLLGFCVRQVWNVIEGEQNGVSVLIFDSVHGSRGGSPVTLVACHTEQSPFGTLSADRVVQAHGWTVLYGVWFLWFSWLMSVRRLDNHLKSCALARSAKS